MLNKLTAIVQDHTLRGDVFDVGCQFHKREALLAGEWQDCRESVSGIPATSLPGHNGIPDVAKPVW